MKKMVNRRHIEKFLQYTDNEEFYEEFRGIYPDFDYSVSYADPANPVLILRPAHTSGSQAIPDEAVKVGGWISCDGKEPWRYYGDISKDYIEVEVNA